MLASTLLFAQVTEFKLKNGLTVIVSEDHSTPEVYGNIVVRAGSVDEPIDATGTAHYLEHVMFKGSQKLGTTNWEAEKVHYEKIIALYDQLAATPEEGREAIQQQINDESIKASTYTINNEYQNMIQDIGGTMLNASTGHDVTQYFNVFPSYQLKKWLELQYDRFESPVFRGFQAELETVYEEKNMYSDDPYTQLREMFLKEMFGDACAYSRPIIGLSEHLKTPSISKLIKYYKSFYVPENMALVLAGDVTVEQARELAEQTVGKWENRPMPQRTVIEQPVITKNQVIKQKMTPYPTLLMGFSGAKASDADRYKLEVLEGVLNNRTRTGLLDKITLDGDAMTVSFNMWPMRQAGVILVQGIPVFDMAQMRFGSLKSLETTILKTIQNLMDGQVDDWLIQSVKDNLIMTYELDKESMYSNGSTLVGAFAYEINIDELQKYPELIKAVTKEDVIAMAKKYLDKPHLTIQSLQGTAKKDKIAKPSYKPLTPATGRSEFAKAWMAQEIKVPEFKPIDFEKDIKRSEIAKGVNMFYVNNPQNDIFSLTIKYGAGTSDIRGLAHAVNLMNQAGIMAQYSPYELKREFSKLGCTVSFGASDHTTTVTMRGKEANLARACQLLSRMLLMPSLDEKQMNRIIGTQIGRRQAESKDKDTQSKALSQYLFYGKNSDYIDRPTNTEISAYRVSQLAADFIKATQYETEVHYVGRNSFDVAKNFISKNLAFPSNLKPASKSERQLANYNENTILLLNNKDARQGDIYLFVRGDEFDKKMTTSIAGFNRYFGGGMNGLVFQELRELRSFAYTATSNYVAPNYDKETTFLYGYIGTQADKVNDAIDEFVKLITDMPQHPDRLQNIKNYLELSNLSTTPMLRYRSQTVSNWLDEGYTQDPRIEWLKEYKNMTFEQILDFYSKRVKGRPISIAIVVNTKNIDKDRLKKFGKIIEVKTSDIFKY